MKILRVLTAFSIFIITACSPNEQTKLDMNNESEYYFVDYIILSGLSKEIENVNISDLDINNEGIEIHNNDFSKK